MKNRIGKIIVPIVIGMLVMMSFPLASAPPPGSCTPWPECKDGGGDPPSTPADPAIAYTTTGQKSLWVMDADGSHQTQIHTSDENIQEPTWAPDGSAIAFGVGIVYEELWRINVSLVDGVPVGNNATMLHPNIDFSVEWSPAGDVILFVERISDLYHLRTIPATGGNPTTLYTTPSGFAPIDPTWSPDASSIAYVEMELLTGPDNYSINVFDVASESVMTVFGPVTTNIYWLEWGKSSGSTEIAFSMVTGGSFSVYTIDIELSNPPVLIEGSSRFPSWSPDDSEIAYTVTVYSKNGRRLRGANIWVENVASGDRTELVNGWALDWLR